MNRTVHKYVSRFLIIYLLSAIIFCSETKRQLQMSPTSIGGEKDEVLSYFSAGVQTPVPVAALSVQKTSAEIEELSLRTPRPVATTE